MNSQILIIVIIAVVVVWLMSRWYYQRKEGFAPMDANTFEEPNYMQLEPRFWESRPYIPKPEVMVPRQEVMVPRQESVLPHNVPTEETVKVSGTENINQQGAPLEEVIKEEVNLTQPIQHMSPELQEILRQEERKLQELNSQYQKPTPEVKPEFKYPQAMTPELRQAEMEQRMRNMAAEEYHKQAEMEQQIRSEVRPETEFRHAEMVPEYSEHKLVQELPQEQHAKVLHQELMPGMEQKQLLEEKLSKVLGEQVVIEVKSENNNLALAVLLSVLLVGFIYQTRE